MPRLRTSVLICLLCGWGILPRTSAGWETIYGSVSHEARQVSSASRAVQTSLP